METVIVSVNPKAGRRNAQRRINIFVKTLEKFGLNVEVKTDLDEVAQRANELFDQGTLRALVGVGGDGTAAELTNRTKPGVPISLLASGTANLLAKHLRYSMNPVRMAKIIVRGKTATFDVAQANGRLFLAMVGCGFDAKVVEQVHAARMSNPKGAHINYFSYLKPIFNTIFSYRFSKMNVEVLDDSGLVEKQYSGAWVFISNIPRYGWGIRLAPRAKNDDGLLDLCVYSGRTLFGGIILTIAAQLCGLHRLMPRVRMVQGRRFRISSAKDVEIPYQLDGDPGGNIPLEVNILERRLTLIVKK